MLYTNKKGILPFVAGLLAVVAASSFSLLATPALAQKSKKNDRPWVKLCDKAPVKKDKAGKLVQKEICLTHHERLNGLSGLVLVSAAIREIEGRKQKQLMIMVPHGMLLQAGVKVFVDENKEPFNLPYSICTPGGCTAEINADAKIIDKMKKGKIMTIGVYRYGKPIGFKIPLEGFGEALAGKPIDNEVYLNARRKLLGKIRERRIELRKKLAAQAKKKQKK